MGKYMYLWKVDMDKAPADPKERGAAWDLLLEMVKNDMKRGVTKAWGAFVGESEGFCVAEGTEVEVALALQQYAPYVSFTGHAFATVDQTKELAKAMTG